MSRVYKQDKQIYNPSSLMGCSLDDVNIFINIPEVDGMWEDRVLLAGIHLDT